MPQDEQQVWSALAAAYDMPYGAAQVAAVEQVMAAADAGQWPELQFAARSLAVLAYEYAGEPSKMFVPFAWCVAALDRGEAPDERSERTVLWRFKHVVAHLTRFPDVPLDRTRSVLDDMERRYRAGGHSMHAVHQHRWLVATHLGDAAEAAEQYRLWCAAPRDELSDCAGCEPTARIEHLAGIGADEEAVELSVPVLAGELTCVEQPQLILTSLLLPYLRTGRHRQAAEAHRRAYRALRSARSDLASVADHVEFCARTGNEPRGLELVSRHLGWLADPCDPYAQMRFAAAAALLLRRLAAAGHGDDELDRPAFGGVDAGTTTVAALRAELAEHATTVAARFDRRNGTGHQGATIAALLAAEPLVERLPLARAGWGSPTPVAADPAPEPVAVPELPSDPVGLADAAENHGQEFRDDAEQAAWARFDEVCPEPTGGLAGRRLVARGLAESGTDIAAAEQAWRAAIELLADAPVRRHNAASLAGLARCRQGDAEAGIAELTEARDALAALAEAQRTRASGAASTADPVPADADPAVAVRAAQERLGMGLDAADRVPDAIAAIDEALRLPADDRHTGRSHALLTFMYARAEDHPAALAHGAQAVRLLAGRPTEMVAGVRMLCGRLHAQADDFAAALPEFRAAAGVAEGPARAEAVLLCGHAALDAGRPEQAVEPLTEAVGLWSELGDARQVARLRAALADALARTGRTEEAAGVGEDALDGLDTDEDLAPRIDTLLLLGSAYRELRATDAAVEALDEVAGHCAARGNAAGVGESHARIAEALDAVDRDAEAAQRWAASAAAFHDARRAAEHPDGPAVSQATAGSGSSEGSGDSPGSADPRGSGSAQAGGAGGGASADRAEAIARLAVDELRSARNAALSWQWAGESGRALAALPAADAVAEIIDTDRPHGRWELAVLGYDAGRILAAADRPADALDRTGPAAELLAGLRAAGAIDPAPPPIEVAVRTLHARLLTELGRRADARGVLTALLAELPADAEQHRADIADLLAATEH